MSGETVRKLISIIIVAVIIGVSLFVFNNLLQKHEKQRLQKTLQTELGLNEKNEETGKTKFEELRDNKKNKNKSENKTIESVNIEEAAKAVGLDLSEVEIETDSRGRQVIVVDDLNDMPLSLKRVLDEQETVKPQASPEPELSVVDQANGYISYVEE